MKRFSKICLIAGSIFVIAGLAIGCTTAIMGGFSQLKKESVNSDDIYTLSESYEGVKKIVMDIDAGNVYISQGESFSIESKSYTDSYESSFDEQSGTWTIKGNHKRNYDYSISFFGFYLRNGKLVWNDYYIDDTYITVPYGTTLESLDISLAAGNVELTEITADELNVDIAAGYLYSNMLWINNTGRLSVNAGSIDIDGYGGTADLDLDVKAGQINLSGQAEGNITGSVNAGTLELSLENRYDDFNYNLTNQLGEIIINEKQFDGIKNNHEIDNKAEKTINLKSNMGTIRVNYEYDTEYPGEDDNFDSDDYD